MLIAINIDKKWKWIATDEDGDTHLFTHKPTEDYGEFFGGFWSSKRGHQVDDLIENKEAAKDWKNSLKRIEEIEMVD